MSARITIIRIVLMFCSVPVFGSSVHYIFTDTIPAGITVEGVPASVVDSSLRLDIDASSQTWTARVRVTVNKDISAHPVMLLRYRVGTPVAGTTGNIPVTLMIDDIYNQNGDAGTWRIYPTIDLSTADWQELEIDLSPLISSWETTHGTDHGVVQEIMMFIGNNNGPFVSNAFYLDYIHIGDRLDVRSVQISPDSPREIIADLGVPVGGIPTTANFSFLQNDNSLEIDSVAIRGESTLLVYLAEDINIPREVLDVPSWILSYSGNDEISDVAGNLLLAFQKEVSYEAYVANFWKYWGDYVFSEEPVAPSWFAGDTVIPGWDWSLPEFAAAEEYAYLWYRDTPGLHFSFKTLNEVYVSWNELEPVRGEYNFEPLRQKIREAAVGYDGVTLRLLAAVWKWDTYPVPGGDVPKWLADRTSAPRWMENLDIATIRMGNAGVVAYNMDIMDPDYHQLYKDFIRAMGESGIPGMEELKIVNVCYRSASAGEEFTKYDPGNNAIEAQYSAEVVEQRTKERLDVWAEAFGEHVRKLMYVGSNESAFVTYGGQLGIGSRQGFVEMYNYTVDAPQFGLTVNEQTRYAEVDETNLFIANNLAFGEENEEYTSESKFGWKESFPYRYYVSSFRMLQQRRNYVMHAGNTLNPELTWYVGMGLSANIENTPDAWAMLSEYYLSPWANNGKAGPLKNIERWLYQRDLPGYETTPAMKVPTAKQLWYADENKPYDFTARKGRKIGFNIDDRMFPDGEQPMAVKVTFYDGVEGNLKLKYRNNEGIQSDSVISRGEDIVRTATFFIHARTDDTGFDHDFDFILESEAEVPVFFVRVVQTEATYGNTDQQAFKGINHTIPGLIECEQYDVGDEGFAFHDDDLKEGDLTQRPADNVDILAIPTASNGFAVGYTQDGEWLEYTVDVTPGEYDITLYYYCGDTAGDLLMSLDGQLLDTLSGMEIRGWETLDSLTLRQVTVEGGKDKILRLEFTNGAGFHIDAVVFKVAGIPVNDVTLSGCPVENLAPGDTLRLEATISPLDAADQAVEWNSSVPEVATVDSTGLIHALSAGTTRISASAGEGQFTDGCVITIGSDPNSMSDPGTATGLCTIYPNPASDMLYFSFTDQATRKEIRIYNLQGKLLISRITNDTKLELSIRDLNSAPVLIVKVLSGKQISFMKVIVGERTAGNN